MKRRELFQAVGVGAVAIGSLPRWLRAASDEPECDVDVLVIGGGTAGTVAALRVQATCMAMGQAAGAAAALAAKRKTSPTDVPLEELRSVLREHQAIVPA